MVFPSCGRGCCFFSLILIGYTRGCHRGFPLHSTRSRAPTAHQQLVDVLRWGRKKMEVNHTLRVTHRLLLLLEDHPFPFVRLVFLSSSLLPLVLVLLPLVVGSVGGWWHSHPSSRTPPPTTIKQGCTTRLTAVKRPSQHPPSLPSYAFLFT